LKILTLRCQICSKKFPMVCMVSTMKCCFTILLHLYLKVDVLSVKKLVKLGIFCKICCTEPYGCLPSNKCLVHLYAVLRSGKDESKFSSLCQNLKICFNISKWRGNRPSSDCTAKLVLSYALPKEIYSTSSATFHNVV
jgi:hypothetical protein